MNLSELLIIFVNKVLITQTKDVLLCMSSYNTSYHHIHLHQQKAEMKNKPGNK